MLELDLELLHSIIICATAEWWAKHWQKLQYAFTIQNLICTKYLLPQRVLGKELSLLCFSSSCRKS